VRTLARLDATAPLNIVPDIAADRPAHFDEAGVDEPAAMSAEQRIAKLRAMADRVFNAAAISSFLMARDTTAVVDLTRSGSAKPASNSLALQRKHDVSSGSSTSRSAASGPVSRKSRADQ
jgi:hypothetical protein